MNGNSNPLVTIGIPAYNAERFIGWAIKSVLNQTYGNFELIITDDGSSDRTVEIAKSFDDPRIKIISDGENHGISYRLNQQIDLAKGEYFARMDADDIMMPDRIETQLKYLINNPSVDLIGGSAIIIDDENQIIGQRCTTKPYKYTIENWLREATLIHPTVFGKISFFRSFLYRKSFKGVEDLDLWLRSCEQSTIYCLPDKVMFYRDPLKFKLKTYLFRRKQSEKLFRWARSVNKMDNSTCNKIIRRSKFKCIIATLLNFTGADKLMIRRRNQNLSDGDYYKRILYSLTV